MKVFQPFFIITANQESLVTQHDKCTEINMNTRAGSGGSGINIIVYLYQ